MILFYLFRVDFDEQTADDWDVDMSVYYDKGATKDLYFPLGSKSELSC